MFIKQKKNDFIRKYLHFIFSWVNVNNSELTFLKLFTGPLASVVLIMQMQSAALVLARDLSVCICTVNMLASDPLSPSGGSPTTAKTLKVNASIPDMASYVQGKKKGIWSSRQECDVVFDVGHLGLRLRSKGKIEGHETFIE